MPAIGDTITVSYEESRRLRKQGWKPRNDVVVMMYVGKAEEPRRPGRRLAPDKLSQSPGATRMRSLRATRVWSREECKYVDRKLAEASC